MRIVSTFKDFYDVVRGLDRDPEPLYVRTTEEREIERVPAHLKAFFNFAAGAPWTDAFRSAGIDTVRVAFCGKAYFFYEWNGRLFETVMALEEYVRSLPEDKREQRIFGNGLQLIPDAEVRLEKGRDLLVKAFDKMHKDRAEGNVSDWNRKYHIDRKGWEASGVAVTDMPVEMFREEKSPILIWGPADPTKYYDKRKTLLTKNPRLSFWFLEKVWHPSWAWQELDMFLGNQMATQFDPSSARTDELARDYHGFDDRSFKNVAPGTRKARRKANKERKRGGGDVVAP